MTPNEQTHQDRLGIITSANQTMYYVWELKDTALQIIARPLRATLVALAGDGKLHPLSPGEYYLRVVAPAESQDADLLRKTSSLFLVREGGIWLRVLSYRTHAVEDDLLVADYLFRSHASVPPAKIQWQTDRTNVPDISLEELTTPKGPELWGPEDQMMEAMLKTQQNALTSTELKAGAPGVYLGADCVEDGYEPTPLPGLGSGKPSMKLSVQKETVKFKPPKPHWAPMPPSAQSWGPFTGNPLEEEEADEGLLDEGGWFGKKKKQNPPNARMEDLINAAEQEKPPPVRKSRLDALMEDLEEEPEEED